MWSSSFGIEIRGIRPMIFKDDVEFLIDEYTCRFGEAPTCLTGSVFPNRRDWTRIVRTLRNALDSGKPVAASTKFSNAA